MQRMFPGTNAGNSAVPFNSKEAIIAVVTLYVNRKSIDFIDSRNSTAYNVAGNQYIYHVSATSDEGETIIEYVSTY